MLLARVAVIVRLYWGWRICFQTHSCGSWIHFLIGCWTEALVLCHVGLYIGMPHSMATGFPPKWATERDRDRERQTERDRNRERQNRCFSFLYPNLGSDAPSPLLYAVVSTDHPWYNTGKHSAQVWSRGEAHWAASLGAAYCGNPSVT